MKISIAQHDPADVLATLYNVATPFGLGFCHYDPAPLTTQQARELLKESKTFDYLRGRRLKLDFSNPVELDVKEYAYAYGLDVLQEALEALRPGEPDNDVTRRLHNNLLRNVAQDVRESEQSDSFDQATNTISLGMPREAVEAAGKVLESLQTV